ncbi:hypothetical protein ACUXCC_002611 [Cytobacillus horneckiae]|uniref:hypothetical protein n=2 Tax=Cytobacillus horneckiae TaxID=549687 RepID=UPI0019D25674|nr:hypothetical protein [Cytobacillus horneckiae]MBN6887493.1 hypothetical protein [Cytobacillus horneckiae]
MRRSRRVAENTRNLKREAFLEKLTSMGITVSCVTRKGLPISELTYQELKSECLFAAVRNEGRLL